MVAVAEKAVLRVVDLLDWVVPAYNLNWERGAKSVAARVILFHFLRVCIYQQS